jgi:hypothetical protein
LTFFQEVLQGYEMVICPHEVAYTCWKACNGCRNQKEELGFEARGMTVGSERIQKVVKEKERENSKESWREGGKST